MLGLRCRLVRSSALGVGPELRGQARILEIASQLGATDYVNAPGGRELYDAQAFAARRIRLHFLAEWKGPTPSLLQALAGRDPALVAADILDQTPDLWDPGYSAAAALGA